jgi:hypothetical protein
MPMARRRRIPNAGSYNEPMQDRLALCSFGWKVLVDGAHGQLEPRTVLKRAPGTDIEPDFVLWRIEAALVEHLEGWNVDQADPELIPSTLTSG